MAVNYTLSDFEEALTEHQFGLTVEETWEFEQFIRDFWHSNLYSDGLQPLDELVDEFIGWLSDNEKSFENREKMEKLKELEAALENSLTL